MFVTEKALLPAIAILEIALGAWFSYRLLHGYLAEDWSLSPQLLVAALLFLSTTVIAGILLLFRTRSGIWLSVAVQVLQVYSFSAWKLGWGVVLGPYLLVRVWPPIHLAFGFTFHFGEVFHADPIAAMFTLNLVPGVIVGYLLAYAKGEEKTLFGDQTV